MRGPIAFIAALLLAAQALAGPAARDLLLLQGNLGPTLSLDFTKGSLPGGVTFTRASSRTCFDATGVMQTLANNVPCFDFDPASHTARGLLIEPQSTNILLNSAALSTQTVVTTAVPYTLSFYGTGTVTLSGTFAGSLVGSGVFPSRATLTFTPTAGSLVVTVSGTVQDAQIEALNGPSSYIATAGTTATRAADVAAVVSAAISSPSGTVQINGQMSVLGSSADIGSIGVDTNNIYVDRVFFVNSTTIKGQMVVIVGGTVFSSINANLSITNGAAIRSTISYGPSSQSIIWNGSGLAGIGTLAQQPALTKLFIGTGRLPAPSTWISKVVYWPRRLSVTEMAKATR